MPKSKEPVDPMVRKLINLGRRLKVKVVADTIRRRNGRIEAELVNFFQFSEPKWGRSQADAVFGE